MKFSFQKISTLSRRRGFTLLEIAIATVISLMATGAIFSIFTASSKMAVESFARNKTAMDARVVIDRLTSDARMATSIEKSYGKFQADANTLILKLPAVDNDGFAVDPESVYDYVVYHQEGQSPVKFIRTVVAHAGSSRVSEDQELGNSTTPGVYAIQPDAVGNFVVYYRFNSVQKYGHKTIEIPAAGSVQLRNHS